MSDQDKTRADRDSSSGAQPSPAAVAANLSSVGPLLVSESGPIRQPQDATVVVPSGLGVIAASSPRRTMVGVAANRAHE
ncbi:MAG: hypothetical protein H7138_18220, partial [Myxococcales bacterium]|nr:hypothetical protein [Myxococcales bacterium]